MNYPRSIGATCDVKFVRRTASYWDVWEVSYRPLDRRAPAAYVYFRTREDAVSAMPLIRSDGGKRIQLWRRVSRYRREY